VIERKLKIKDNWYEYISCEAQIKMTFDGYHKNAMDHTIRFDKKYLNDFKVLFDKMMNHSLASDYKFDMRIGNLISHGCIIRKLDLFEDLNFEVNITSDYYSTMSLADIRDEKIDEILKN
jgi:hypothetical protein